MVLLDSILGQLQGAASGSDTATQGGLMDAIGGLLNDPKVGGLSGLVAAFEQKGLGGVVASWIGTGDNQAISPDQLQSVLGSEQMQAMAQKLGLDSQQVSGHLAQVLPQVIDKLTPHGTLPGGAESAGGLGGALGGMFDMLKGGKR